MTLKPYELTPLLRRARWEKKEYRRKSHYIFIDVIILIFTYLFVLYAAIVGYEKTEERLSSVYNAFNKSEALYCYVNSPLLKDLRVISKENGFAISDDKRFFTKNEEVIQAQRCNLS